MKRGLVLVALLLTVSCEKVDTSVTLRSPPEIIRTAGGQEMVLIPSGEFTMGSNRGQPDEIPPHTVRVSSFLMDRTEVTQEMYEKLKLVNPSKAKGATLPVNMMSWVLAARYCNARSKAEDLEPCYNEDNAQCDFAKSGYRLPTEAEWEYACRAAITSDTAFSSDPRKLRELAWFSGNSEGKPHSVAQKSPNPWGLYDMLGNVAEWCNDMYDTGYYKKSPPADPRGPAEAEQYVVRGGSYKSSPDSLRPTARSADNPGFSDACLAPETLGIRCVRKPAGNR